jgi:hypothetical protein
MRANELLTERVLNLLTSDDKLKYADTVWDMLQTSYVKAGGFHSADDIADLIQKTHLWKLVKRGSRITAASLYKDKHGRKTIASATDGTPQGKHDYGMIKDADIHLGRAWCEVSGAPEHLMQKAGLKPLPSKFAPLLTGKPIDEYNEDGYHYTRVIHGHPHEKAIYGSVKITPEVSLLLAQHNIDLRELPEHFRKT